MAKISIAIAYHKKDNFYTMYPYIPIQVGAIYNEALGIQKDSEGDNISRMNAYCSELSATYWLWRNRTADYKGLFHYRRFMTFKKNSFLKRIPTILLYYASKCAAPFIRDSRCFLPQYSIINIKEDEVEQHLSSFAKELEHDITQNGTLCYSLGAMKHSTRSMETHLRLGIGGKHFEYLIPMIKENYPSFYPYLKRTLRSGKLIGYNMIIARHDIFDEYCSILFGILEKYHHYFTGNLYEGQINNALLRDSGYVGEIITDAYLRMIEQKGIYTKKLNCAFVDITPTGLSYQRKSIYTRIKEMLGI